MNKKQFICLILFLLAGCSNKIDLTDNHKPHPVIYEGKLTKCWGHSPKLTPPGITEINRTVVIDQVEFVETKLEVTPVEDDNGCLWLHWAVAESAPEQRGERTEPGVGQRPSAGHHDSQRTPGGCQLG